MLPKIDVPFYELTLPSTGKKVSYRPFLVKEEKIMLMAAQGGDPEEIKNSIIQIVRNCILDESFSPENAPIFDIEWILLNLRAKSVGSKVVNKFVCSNVKEDGSTCNNPFEVEINLSDVAIDSPNPNKKIMLTDKVGVIMRYPRFSVVQKVSNEIEFSYDILSEAIEMIFDENSTYSLKDSTKEEITEFLESMTKEQFDKVSTWLDNIPEIKIHKEYKCAKCGFVHKINIEDLTSFF